MLDEIAWVGWTNSSNDIFYQDTLIEKKFIPRLRIDDYIDIINGRDFLEEEKQYQIIVLCYIFNLQCEQDQRTLKKQVRSKWRTSNLSTIENWWKRFEKANSSKIITIGNKTEISSDYLGNNKNYKKIIYKFSKDENAQYCNTFAVFMKV